MTLAYVPPLKEIQFVLDLVQAEAVLQQLPASADLDSDLIMQVLTEAGRFCQEVLFPTNQVGDTKGAVFNNGQVSTPPGFAEAYRQFREAGWTALSFDPDYGGQGLPHTLNTIVHEMLGSANHAWTMYPGLLDGAYSCIKRFASEELKNTYLPKLVSGEWLATMCLTEDRAGSDLGLLRTRAEPAADGSYRISGNKIFISGGEQDLTENIVHLVLARLPDAPRGSKGISLFLVPKLLPDGNGGFEKNQVFCTGIEEKMGIHGSATCSMLFENAKGWLVGEPNRGLASMFVMMNSARLLVGVQGIGTAEVALQNALTYAKERVQMRAPQRPESRQGQPADPIILHPAMQRLLMNQKAYVECLRMLIYWAALHLDQFHGHPDESVRQRSDQLLALLTPVIKSVATEQSFKGASEALQVYGGHGFITETGIDQYLRDSRITLIYEGTNEIQAIDLLLRKILADNGQALQLFIEDIRKTTRQCDALHQPYAAQLEALCDDITRYARAIGKQSQSDGQLPYRIAGEMLRLVAHAALGWFWLQAVMYAQKQMDTDTVFFQGKIDTARYYFNYLFPEIHQHRHIIEASLKQSEAGHTEALLAAGMND